MGNLFMMMAIAGILDGIAGAAANAISKNVFKVGLIETTKQTKFLAWLVDIGIDFVAEVVTEVLPRANFNEVCPFNMDDLYKAIPAVIN